MAQQRSIALTISVSKEATRSEAVSAEEGLPQERWEMPIQKRLGSVPECHLKKNLTLRPFTPGPTYDS